MVAAAACATAVDNFAAVGYAVAAGAGSVVAPAHTARIWGRRQTQSSASCVAVERRIFVVASDVQRVAEGGGGDKMITVCGRTGFGFENLMLVEEGKGGDVDAVQLPDVPKR